MHISFFFILVKYGFHAFLDVGMEGDRGLVAGRSQREKRRSYKDLLREEEEIAAQVRKSSKKRPKVSCHQELSVSVHHSSYLLWF